jgi:hypothetical protein
MQVFATHEPSGNEKMLVLNPPRKSVFNKYDDKFVDEIETSAGRTKNITLLERTRTLALGMFVLQLIVALLVECGGSQSINGLFPGLCAMTFMAIFLWADIQIKWLKSINHHQMLNDKNKA